MAEADEERAVGRVVKAHGLRGELVVAPSTDHVDRRYAPGAVLSVRGGRGGALPSTLTVTTARRHGERLLVVTDEVADRDTADALRSATLTAAPLDDGPDDPEGFEDHQLEGLSVELADGTVVGTVREVLHSAGGELLVVERPGDVEALVPFVHAIVPVVDLTAGRLVLDPPDGLLDGG